MRYEHVQTAPIYLLLVVIGFSTIIGGVLSGNDAGQLALCSVGAAMLLLAMCFRQLTVRDEDESLLISFGPLPLFRRRVLLADIESVERGRTTFLDGWGIHYSLSGGWVWNLWGFDCVLVHFKNGKLLKLGTDDPDGLESFLNHWLTDNG